jgi:hypothetical protein
MPAYRRVQRRVPIPERSSLVPQRKQLPALCLTVSPWLTVIARAANQDGCGPPPTIGTESVFWLGSRIRAAKFPNSSSLGGSSGGSAFTVMRQMSSRTRVIASREAASPRIGSRPCGRRIYLPTPKRGHRPPQRTDAAGCVRRLFRRGLARSVWLDCNGNQFMPVSSCGNSRNARRAEW